MAFSSLIKDSLGVPVPQVYVPGVGFVALAGSTGSNTDGSSNTSTGVNFNFNQVNNAALSSSNPVPTQDFIRTMILAGQGFSASASNSTAGATDPGVSLFNNSTAKNVLIYSILAVANAATTFGHQLRSTTSDPALGTAVTPVNLKLGGGASAIAANCSSSNAQTNFPGSLLHSFGLSSNSPTELLTNGRCILLSANAANGIFVEFVFGGVQSWFCVASYVEY